MDLMKRMILNDKEKLITTAVQLIKFCGVGVINTAVDFGVFWILVTLGPAPEVMPLFKYIAQTISYVLAVLCSYLLNRHFTFKASGQTIASIVKMYVQSGVIFLFMQALLWLFYEKIGVQPEILAKLLATVPTTILNFLGSKFWVFRTKEEPKQ